MKVRWEKGIYTAQAFNTWGYIQVGTLGIWLGSGTKRYAWRLELFTPYRYWRVCRSKPEGYKGKTNGSVPKKANNRRR